MTIDPLLSAPLPVQIHAFAAIAAFCLGAVQLAAAKGTLPHRRLGWVWAALMVTVALTSFFIHTICTLGGFSPIHLLSLYTLISLPLALLYARRHRIKAHGKAMTSIFIGALIIAGAFTLLPGRLMHVVVFGGPLHAAACG